MSHWVCYNSVKLDWTQAMDSRQQAAHLSVYIALTWDLWLSREYYSHDYWQEHMKTSGSMQWRELAPWGIYPHSPKKNTISEAGKSIPPMVVWTAMAKNNSTNKEEVIKSGIMPSSSL